MTWFKREDNEIVNDSEKTVRTEGLWIKCPGCQQAIFRPDLGANLNVCPKCGHHFRMGARARLDMLLEPGYELFDTDLQSTDPLDFVDLKRYKQRLAQAQHETGMNDAVLSSNGSIGQQPVVMAALEYRFIMGSMGAVVGEMLARAVDRAHETRTPLIIISASGGARMMEGIVSLLQLAKVSSALGRLDDAGIPYISVLADPTTGGVTASFAMLGDLNIGEPGALIGFAGPPVIEQTMRQKLPKGFQRSEFQLAHGFLDAIVPRKEMKSYLEKTLGWMTEKPAAHAS